MKPIIHFSRARWRCKRGWASSWTLNNQPGFLSSPSLPLLSSSSSSLLPSLSSSSLSSSPRCFSTTLTTRAELKLRDYQEECIQSVIDSLKRGIRRLGISLATGSGKTIIFTQLISRIPPPSPTVTRTLILAHRRELVHQAAKHCNSAYPDLNVEIEMGPLHATGTADVTIASLQSITSKDRLDKYDRSRFKLVLVDEAHHIVSRGYLRVLHHFGLGEGSERNENETVSESESESETNSSGNITAATATTPSRSLPSRDANTITATTAVTAATIEAKTITVDGPALVGVSATFSRFDGLRLGVAIDEIVYHRDYVDMIGDKWLSDVIFTTVESSADLSKVRGSSSSGRAGGGDFNTGDLSDAVNTEEINEITVRSWLAKAGDRRSTLVFCVDLAHVTGLTRRFRHHGIDARFVTGDTPKILRADTLDAFRRAEFPVLVNCGVFTEGTDIPNIDCVLLARPTKSRNLLIQMIGRGMRLHPAKTDCHVIDMVSSLDTGIVTTPTLFGLDPDLVVQKATVKDLEAAKARREAEALRADTAYGSDAGSDSGFGSSSGSDSGSLALQIAPEKAKITFTEYSSVFDLITDTSGEKHIRAISQHAWVQIGDERFILCGPTGSFIRIERLEATAPTGADRTDRTDSLPSSETQTPKYRAVEVRSLPAVVTQGRTKSPFATPREILRAATLGDAVRGCDSFAAQIFPHTFIHRYQTWRSGPATQGQLDFLNKLRSPEDVLTAETLTKGRAMDMITKLKHGAKGRFAQLQQQKRKKERADLLDKRRTLREIVTVGPLSA